VHFPRVESRRLFWEGASAADGWARHSRIPGASRGDVGTMTGISYASIASTRWIAFRIRKTYIQPPISSDDKIVLYK